MKAIGAAILLFISSIFGFGQKSPETKPVVQKQTVPPSVQTVATTTQTQQRLPVKISATKKSSVATSAQKVSQENTSAGAASNQTQTQTQTQSITEPQIPLVTLNTEARAALVNILCNTQAGGPLSPISGSGVLISSNGVIMTNAHVGQFFLLKNFNGQKNSVQCVIRTGNPAYPEYNAELVYISPTWITQNKSILLESTPQGTGEHDYALLIITGKIDGSALPTTFPFLPISLSETDPTGQFTLLASYPAGFLGGQSIVQDLFQSSAETTVQKIFTFATDTVDLLSVPGTVVSQSGSSGGAVVNGVGQLVGIISTDSSAKETSGRDLNAITTAYINRDLKSESGQTIADLLESPTAYAQDFNANIAPNLTEILTNAILQK